MKKILTLCVVHRSPRVLLGMKKRGFGVGKWNGFGGKVQSNETIEEAARRELEEEAGIIPTALFHMGILEFEFIGEPDILEVHVFKVRNFSGVPTESEEMKPQWFQEDEVPFTDMWADDVHWFPLLFADKKFKGKFLFEGTEYMLEKVITEIT